MRKRLFFIRRKPVDREDVERVILNEFRRVKGNAIIGKIFDAEKELLQNMSKNQLVVFGQCKNEFEESFSMREKELVKFVLDFNHYMQSASSCKNPKKIWFD